MHGETAEKIITTANSLMVERGYSGFSYADVSDVVGISKASIHHHFPTKCGLAVAVLADHRARLLEAMETMDQQIENPLGRLQAYLNHWEVCIRERKMTFCVAAVLACELPSLPEEVRAQVTAHFEALCAWLERTLSDGVKRGVVRLLDSVTIEAQTLMALVHGAMLSARASGNSELFRLVTAAALGRISGS